MSFGSLVPLGDIVELIRGVSYDKTQAKRIISPNTVPIFRGGSIQQTFDSTVDPIYVPQEIVAPEQKLQEMDIAMCLSSGSKELVGKCALIESSIFGALGAFCTIIRPKGIDPRFLLRYFQSDHFAIWLTDQTRGANIQNLRTSQLQSLTISLPPLEVQRQIVSRIEASTNQIRFLEAIFSSQLIDLEAYRIRQIHRLFGIENSPISFGSESPKSFVPLIDISELETGHTPSRNRPDWWGGEIPWLASPDIRAADGKCISTTLECTNNEGLANSSARLLPANSVAFSRTASVGFVTILGRNMAVSQDFAVWVCGEKLDPQYLMAALRISRDHLLTASSGAVHNTIYMGDLKSFRIHLPTISVQQDIVRKIAIVSGEVERMQNSIRTQLSDLSSFNKALLRETLA